MPKTDIETLQQLTEFEPLIDYLRDSLGWPIEVEDLDDATFEYSADELGIKPQYAARITSIKQLRPLTDGQVWGIFFVEFGHSRLPVMALRRILQKLVETGRNRPAELPAWKRDDLLFICLYTSDAEGKEGQRGITFAHFRQGEGGLPELRTFSWDSRETHFYYLRNLNLQALHWPPNDRDAEAWREQWRDAFTVRHREVIHTAERLATAMARQARQIRDLVGDLYAAEGETGALHMLFTQLQIGLMHDLQPDAFADMVAQTITYGAFSAAVQSEDFDLAHLPDFIPDTNPFLKDMLRTLTRREKDETDEESGGPLDLDELGVGELVFILQAADLAAITRDFGRQTGSGKEDPVVHFYELFLSEYDKQQKVQRGVFYTPDPVVEYMVRAVGQILQRPVEEGGFGIAGGLASDATTDKGEPLVQILDPATGTGTFLAHIIDHVADRRNPKRQPSEAWNEYVANSLLKRLHGFELMMAPYTIAHLKLGLKLKQTGYTFGEGERLRVYLTNTLEKPVEMSEALLETDYLSREANEANIVKRRAPIMVVIGNPPYSGHSANDMPEDWIKLNDYYFVDGKPLGERNPKWLQDDYVKFIRFGQWRIEQTGEGILAFITPHGYLDSPTFRGMRQQLMRVFDEIYVLDLHGNARKREVAPDGGKDENVFDIMQGVAISVLVKRGKADGRWKLDATVHHQHLWGTRQTKYSALETGEGFHHGWLEVSPGTPFYTLIPQDGLITAEYQQGWTPTDLSPVSVLGFQTHRDHFAIDIERESLRARIEEMRQRTMSDATFRNQYQVSDNQGWRLARARADLRADPQWEQHLILCEYRPFDRRYCYFSEVAMDRPRRELIQNVESRTNLVLGLGRQGKAVDAEVWHLSTISRFPVDANVFRRGGVNLFPLYLYPVEDERYDDREKDWPRTNCRRPNLSRAFVVEAAGKLGLTFVTDGRGDLETTFGPEDIFHYAYAVFHSPEYRARYAEQLKIDFPRLPLTTDLGLFRNLAQLGADLVALHLLEDDYAASSWVQAGQPSPLAPITRFVPGTNGSTVGPMSKSRAYDAEGRRIFLNTTLLNAGSYFEFDESISDEAAQATWEFQVGGYQVLHKWLYDRRPQGDAPGRTLSDEDIRHYQRVVAALFVTQQRMRDIDTVILAHGGFPLPGSVPEAAPEPDSADDGEGDGRVSEQNEWGDPRPRLFRMETDQMSFDDVQRSDHRVEEDGFERVEGIEVDIPADDTFTAEDALTISEGLEVEDTEPEWSGRISRPFDPSRIRMNSQQLNIDILIKRMQDGRIGKPSYQRAAGIWSAEKKSRLMESILIKIPLPAFYIDATDDENWKIIDGLQRLTTLRQFIIDKSLRLTRLEFLDIEGASYDDLPRSLQRRIEETPITVYFVQEGTPPEVTYNIFKRINTGGEALTAQEIRNAIHQGPAVEMLERLAKSEAFLRATGKSIKPLRCADHEVVLRYLAFLVAPEGKPRDNDIDAFMNEAMERIGHMPSTERQQLEAQFYRAMNAAWSILDMYAFRKIMPSGRRSQLSRALFDAWCRNFDALTDEQIKRLSQKRPSSRLLGRFRDLLTEDEAFNKAITASTGDPARVQYRYAAIRHIIHETIGLGE